MNILLITNPIEQSQNHILQLIQQAWDNAARNDGRTLNVKLSRKELDDIKVKAAEECLHDDSKSIMVYEINEKERLKDKKKSNKTSFLFEKEVFKILSSKHEYDVFDFFSFIPKVIFVVPELMWSNDDVNEGYNIAKELITNTYKNEFIQIIFLSVLDRKTIINIVDTSNKSLVEAFPHLCLLDSNLQIQFSYYSGIHFKLIKHLAMSNRGGLQKISHEMNSVKNNIRNQTKEVDFNKTEILDKLNELALFQQWTGVDVAGIVENIEKINDKESLTSISKLVEDIIDEISIKMPNENEESDILKKSKSNFKVLIVEDDRNYRTFFYNILSNFYQDVYPNKDEQYVVDAVNKDFIIDDVGEIIRKNGKNFQIFLLDLLYKDEDGESWLNFNGLDLYLLIRKVNPYAVIRIITSLPRGIVSKLVGVIMSDSLKPNTSQVFSKKYGFEELKDTIIENIDMINKECKAKEKLKNTWTSFPKKGVFKWVGVENLMVELLTTGIDGKKYSDIVETANIFFNKYINNSLDKNTTDWSNGELPKNNREKELNYDEVKVTEYIKGKLISILVHRLIVINEALKNENYIIKYPDYIPVLKKITSRSTLTDSYFFTCLGIHGKSDDGAKDVADKSFKVDLKNLFPHEYSFVKKVISDNEKLKGQDLTDDDKDLIQNIFTKELVVRHWDDLNLNFYKDSNDITQNDFIRFLASIEKNYKKGFAVKIHYEISDLNLDNYSGNLLEFIYSFIESDKFTDLES